jgi:hypothetical protein
VNGELKIALPPEEKPPLTFADHMAQLDDFVADCNAELRKRGFHVCEAHVTGNWMGEAVLTNIAAINSPVQQGVPTLPVACKLPLSWLMPEPLDLQTILSTGLQGIEKAMIEMCSRQKALRISFAEFARRTSRTLTIAPQTNGKRALIVSAP